MPKLKPYDLMFVGVEVPEHIVDIVDAQREVNADGQKKGSLNAAVKAYVETLLANPVPESHVPAPDVVPSTVAPTLAEACKVVVDSLEQAHQNLIHALAREKRLPVEAFVLSPIVRAHDEGRTGVIMHKWLDAPPVQQEPKLEAATICEFCRKPYHPTREGQRFCPEPADGSDSCGRLHGLAIIRAQVEAKRRPPSQFAPPRQPHTIKNVAQRVNSSMTDYVDVG